MHIGWNVLAKKAQDKLAFLWLATLWPGLIGAFFFFYEIQNSNFSLAIWGCLFFSSIIHMLYFWLLANSYKYADLSFVYPYCRGIGALLVILFGIFFLGESPSLIGSIGIFLTVIATIAEPILNKKKDISLKGLFFRIATGCTIACYLVLDKIGVSHMRYSSYVGIMFMMMAIGFSPMMLKNNRFKKEFKNSKYVPFFASLLMVSGYCLVLAAMSIAPLSYVVSTRATGIIISAMAGILFFSEQVSVIRWFSIIIISIGVILIGLA